MDVYKLKRDKPFLEDGLLQSLYYLYQELLKADMQELAYIMEAAIHDCEEAVRRNFTISQIGEEVFKQFHILCQFRRLSQDQKEAFIREIEIENDQTEH